MKQSYEFEEVSLLEIKSRLLRNKKLIFIFCILSIFVSSIVAFNQKVSYEGKIYYSSKPNKENEKENKINQESIRLNSETINPSLRTIVFESENIKDHDESKENIISELVLNPIILERKKI